MIYFIDEDISQLKPYATAFELTGFEVIQISNADAGFLILEDLKPEDYVFLDVMLRTGDAATSIFTKEKTADFIKTGVSFIELAIEKFGPDICKKIAFFTNANQISLLKEVKNASKRYGVLLLVKSDYPNPRDLVQELVEIQKSMTK